MLQINADNSIYLTRGDAISFSVTADVDGEPYIFTLDDIVRISVYAKKNCTDVVLRKDFTVDANSESVDIYLDERETRIGEAISKPTDYWYEVELNPGTNPQTIIGYDEDGPKVFKLFPESDNSGEIIPEDIPPVDSDFSTESNRPLSNSVITLKFGEIEGDISEILSKITLNDIRIVTHDEWEELHAKGTWELNKLYIIKDEEETDTDIEDINTALEAINSRALSAYEIASSAAVTKTYTVDIPESSWQLSAQYGGYMANVSVPGIKFDDNPIADVLLGNDIEEDTATLLEWSKVVKMKTGAGNIVLYAKIKPSSGMKIQLKVVE